MERQLTNLVKTAAQSLVIGSFLPTTSPDGRGVYRITRVIPEENQIYGVLVEKEPLSKPWWHFNRDAGVSDTLPFGERRHVPAAKQNKRGPRKKKVESGRAY